MTIGLTFEKLLAGTCRCCAAASAIGNNFPKVSSIVISRSKFSDKLSFEKLLAGACRCRAAAGATWL